MNQLPTGVYAMGHLNKPFNSLFLTNPNVNGLFINLGWSLLEPQENVYDWTLLDSELANAAANGKKASLVIAMGNNVPQWVYDAGATPFVHTDTQPYSQTFGQNISCPVPWDAIYASKLFTFIKALGAHIGNNPVLSQVKITGINDRTPEIILPHGHADTLSNGMIASDDWANWQVIGYNQTRVLDFWKALVRTWSNAFPNVQLCMMMAPNAFPPIDSTGNLIPKTKADNNISPLMWNFCYRLLGQRFALQNNGVSNFWICPPVITAAANGFYTGHEALWFVTNDDSYRMNSGNTDDISTILRGAVDNVIEGGGHYMEIFWPDILNPALTDVIQYAHDNLK